MLIASRVLRTSTMLIASKVLSRRALQKATTVRSCTVTGNVRPSQPTAHEWKAAKPFDEIPGMSALQWVRAFMKGGEFKGVPLNEVFLQCRQRYGDICRFPSVFGQAAMVTLFNVQHFAHVFRTEGPYPVRPGNEAIIHYRRARRDGFFRDLPGLIGSGEQWWRVRHAVNPILMQPRNARLYVDSVQQVSEEFVERILTLRHPGSLEMPDTFEKEIKWLMFESVAGVALDTRLGLVSNRGDRPRSQALFESIHEVLITSFELSMQPSLYKYFKTPTYRRFERANDRVFDMTGEYIDEALRRIARKPPNSEAKSVLEKLLQIDAKIAQVMAMDLMLGGVDTTTSAFCTTLMCLAKNPEKQEKLRQEVLSIVPRKKDKFTIDNMKEMPYMRACLKEALRVYPLFFGVPREAGVDMVLDGYRVPKGTRLVMCANLLLHEEKYFPRAREFLPERWLRSSSAASPTLNPFVYLPFGFGPRFCIGKRLVDLMFEVNIGNLVRNFRIEFNHPTENAFVSAPMLKPAVPMKFKFTQLD